MTHQSDTKEIVNLLKDRLVAVDLLAILRYYDTRIRTLEAELREAHADNAEALFNRMHDDD